MILAIQWDVEFSGQLAGVEGTAGEKAIADLKGGNFAAAVVDAQDKILGIGIIFDVHFADFNAAILEKSFGATTVGAPGGAVHDDRLYGIGAHVDMRLDAASRCESTGQHLAHGGNVDALVFGNDLNSHQRALQCG